MTRRRRFDPLEVVERGYDLGATEASWLEGIIEAARPGIPGEFVGGSRVQVTDDQPDVVAEVRDPGEPPEAHAIIRSILLAMPHDLRGIYFGPTPFVGAATSDPRMTSLLTASSASNEFGTSVGFAVGDGVGGGIAIGSFAPLDVEFGAAQRQLWFRTVAHVGAAMRLRTRLAQAPCEPLGMLSASGRAQHLAPALQGPGPRARLDDAIQRMLIARGRLRHEAPEQALGLFRALVAGEWSVVDWVDTDGKRMLVVHENPLPLRSPRALTSREAQVAELMVEGRSNSEIGYLLGIGTGTVSRLARDVLAKLGRPRRQDLPRLFERGVMVGELLDAPSTLLVSPAIGDSGTWARLTSAERDVVERALAGESNEDIARARGVSRRTVANQLAAVYARFGVRGRIELGGLLGASPPRASGAPSQARIAHERAGCEL